LVTQQTRRRQDKRSVLEEKWFSRGITKKKRAVKESTKEKEQGTDVKKQFPFVEDRGQQPRVKRKAKENSQEDNGNSEMGKQREQARSGERNAWERDSSRSEK